jgi:hypothetical protein
VERVRAHVERAIHEAPRERVERGAIHREREVERRAARTIRELFDPQAHVLVGGELALAPLGRRAQALERLRVAPWIHAVLREERVGHALGHREVEVVAAEERVARRGEHLEHLPRQLEDGHVEGAAAEIVDDDALPRALAVAVGERGRRRLVEDAHHLEARHLAGRLGGRALQLVEIGGHRDHGARALHAERLLRHTPHLAQHERADLGQRVRLVARDDEHALVRPLHHLEREAPLRGAHLVAVPRAAEQTLGRVDRVLRVEEASLPRRVAHEHVALRVERHDRRDQAIALGIGEHRHARPLGHRDDAVGRAEIDPQDRRRAHPCFTPPAELFASAMRASSTSIHVFTVRGNGHIQP